MYCGVLSSLFICCFICLQLDYMCLGLLVYEMATGKRPYGDIYPLTSVVLAILYDKIKLNIEADHFLQKQGMEEVSRRVGMEEVSRRVGMEGLVAIFNVVCLTCLIAVYTKV